MEGWHILTQHRLAKHPCDEKNWTIITFIIGWILYPWLYHMFTVRGSIMNTSSAQDWRQHIFFTFVHMNPRILSCVHSRQSYILASGLRSNKIWAEFENDKCIGASCRMTYDLKKQNSSLQHIGSSTSPYQFAKNYAERILPSFSSFFCNWLKG